MRLGDNPNPPITNDAANIIRKAPTAALATLDRVGGHPYVSFVTTAVDGDGSPILLLSQLARHTQNLLADPRISLLYTPTNLSKGDPLARARVTILGRALSTTNPSIRTHFLANHPDASLYVDFPDFAFYSLNVSNAHFIGGFGRIFDISGPDLMSAIAATPVT